MADQVSARLFVIMGVSGSGKSTIGSLLAQRIGAAFADADDFHSAANKAKMGAGIPLTDEDRAPWLATLNGVLRDWASRGEHGVLACSALKAVYRQILGSGLATDELAFVWLDLPKEVLQQRLAARHHEYMNAGLLDSQLATLEAPADALRVINDRTPNAVVSEILSRTEIK